MKYVITAVLAVLLFLSPVRGISVEGVDELYRQSEEYGVVPSADLEQGIGWSGFSRI